MKKEKTVKKSSVKRNYIYNLLNQIYALIIPLATIPYVSRVLLADGVGKYSYTASIANYFVMFASLGITMYIQREIANHQGDKHKQSVIFWETNIIKFVTSFLSLALFIILCISGIFEVHTNLMWCWSILIVAQMFDITGLLQGNEKFGQIVLRNVILKTICLILIFVFVKDSNDVWIYIVLNSSAVLLASLALWVDLSSMIEKVKLKELKPKRHILPVLKLFVPTIAISLYTVLDKTLIGVLITDTYVESTTVVVDGIEKVVETTKKYSELENGYYEQAEKIVRMSLTLITALATIMISKNSNEIAKGNKEAVRENLYFSSRFVMLLGVPMAFGLISLAPNLIPWFLGEDFNKSILLMQLFSPLIIILGLGNIFGIQYLVPSKKDTQYIICVCSGAIINLILNIILIPRLWSIGAVIASLTAECIVTAVMYFYTRKEVSIVKVIIDSKMYFLAGILMFIVTYFTQRVLEPSIINTVILVIEGVFVYFSILLVSREEFLFKFLKRDSK